MSSVPLIPSPCLYQPSMMNFNVSRPMYCELVKE